MGLLSVLFGSASSKNTEARTEEARLRDELMRGTQLHECLKIYRQALPESELEKAAWSKITKLATTFSDWETVARFLAPVDARFSIAVGAMFQLAGTCQQMEVVARLCPTSHAIASQALLKLSEKAVSFDAWLVIFSLAEAGSELSHQAKIEVEKHATTVEHWEKVWKNTSDPVLENIALEMRLAKSTTLSELSCLYTDAPGDSLIEKKIEDKFRATTASFDELLAFYENGDSDKTRWDTLLEIVLSWLLAKAQDYEELLSVYDVVYQYGDGDEVNRVLSELRTRPINRVTWQEIYEGADEASPLESCALRNLMSLTDTVDQLLSLYIEYIKHSTDDDMLSEMLDAIVQRATTSELQIIVRLGDCESSLDALVERAEKKLAPKTPITAAVT